MTRYCTQEQTSDAKTTSSRRGRRDLPRFESRQRSSNDLSERGRLQGFRADHRCGAGGHYSTGRWTEARAELLGAMVAFKSFLTEHEPEEKRKQRLARNADIVNAQLAANESLQQQFKDLTEQLEDSKSSYQEVLFQGAQYQKERDSSPHPWCPEFARPLFLQKNDDFSLGGPLEDLHIERLLGNALLHPRVPFL